MPENKKTKFKFICPIFGVEVVLCLGARNVFYFPGSAAGRAGQVIESVDNGVYKFFIWLDNPEDFYCLVHECLHLVREIFKVVGIPFNETNEEIIAYYQSYWVERLWNKISKKIIKENKNDA